MSSSMRKARPPTFHRTRAALSQYRLGRMVIRYGRLMATAIGLLTMFWLISSTPPESAAYATLQSMGLIGGTGRRPENMNVAVIEVSSYHGEVVSSVLQVLHDLGANTTLFNRAEWEHGSVLKDIYPHQPIHLSESISRIRQGDFHAVVLNTCDRKFWSNLDDLTAALQETKVHVICQVHELDWFGNPQGGVDINNDFVAPIGSEARLTFLTLGSHSARALTRIIQRWETTLTQPYWATTPVEWFAPVFNLPSDIAPKVHTAHYNKACVVGRINQESRDYEGIMRELEASILENPANWGYEIKEVEVVGKNQRVTKANRLFPIPGQDSFTLHFIGYEYGLAPKYPPLLRDPAHPVVHVRDNATVLEFYELLRGMDIIFPAFAGDLYTQRRSSASIPAAIIAETPVLINEPELEAYTYLNPTAYIVNPVSNSEIGALTLLRQGIDPWEHEFGNAPTPAPPSRAPGKWYRPAWNNVKPYPSWTAYKDALRKENARIWRKMLMRRVGNLKWEREG